MQNQRRLYLFLLLMVPSIAYAIQRNVNHHDPIAPDIQVAFLLIDTISSHTGLFLGATLAATSIGAFTAGLILHDAYFDSWHSVRECPIRHRYRYGTQG
jgi:hypothetical protein